MGWRLGPCPTRELSDVHFNSLQRSKMHVGSTKVQRDQEPFVLSKLLLEQGDATLEDLGKHHQVGKSNHWHDINGCQSNVVRDAWRHGRGRGGGLRCMQRRPLGPSTPNGLPTPPSRGSNVGLIVANRFCIFACVAPPLVLNYFIESGV